MLSFRDKWEILVLFRRFCKRHQLNDNDLILLSFLASRNLLNEEACKNYARSNEVKKGNNFDFVKNYVELDEEICNHYLEGGN